MLDFEEGGGSDFGTCEGGLCWGARYVCVTLIHSCVQGVKFIPNFHTFKAIRLVPSSTGHGVAKITNNAEPALPGRRKDLTRCGSPGTCRLAVVGGTAHAVASCSRASGARGRCEVEGNK